MTPEQEQLLREIHSTLFDFKGRKGLITQVADNTKAINKIWLAIIAIVAAGSGSGYALVSKVIGG